MPKPFLAILFVFFVVIFSCREKAATNAPFGDGSYLATYKAAEQDDTRLIKQNPNAVNAYMDRSINRFILGDYKGVISDDEYVLKIDPKQTGC